MTSTIRRMIKIQEDLEKTTRPKLRESDWYQDKWLYHGTTRKNAENIRREGFKPGSFFTHDISQLKGFDHIFRVDKSKIKGHGIEDDPFVPHHAPRGVQVRVNSHIHPSLIDDDDWEEGGPGGY